MINQQTSMDIMQESIKFALYVGANKQVRYQFLNTRRKHCMAVSTVFLIDR